MRNIEKTRTHSYQGFSGARLRCFVLLGVIDCALLRVRSVDPRGLICVSLRVCVCVSVSVCLFFLCLLIVRMFAFAVFVCENVDVCGVVCVHCICCSLLKTVFVCTRSD